MFSSSSSLKRRVALAAAALACSAGMATSAAGTAQATTSVVCLTGYVCGYDALGLPVFATAAPLVNECVNESFAIPQDIVKISNNSDVDVKISGKACASAGSGGVEVPRATLNVEVALLQIVDLSIRTP
ncbi:hypothetical protein ACFVOK_07635 [Streptomyces sp. NPDC057798]|uniref:hypothetical protein n=1 Tax=Streptomyces sp. NPDC057798 TaxID=3346252 RepID=UPI00369AF64F